jgi:hypothetical protein
MIVVLMLVWNDFVFWCCMVEAVRKKKEHRSTIPERALKKELN